MSLEELRAKREKLNRNVDITMRNIETIAKESERVANVAHNSKKILDDLDREFELQTGLKGKDITFLFAAVGLQLARIYIFNEITKTEKAGQGNKKEEKLHKLQEKILNKFDASGDAEDRPYHASMKHIITKTGVPYDATAMLSKESIDKLSDKCGTWDFDLTDLIPEDNISLFKGANHRFSTLGHDPILGLIFGTGNIMTNTITCVRKPIEIVGVGLPVVTTNHVVYTSEYKDPRIATYASTAIMLKEAINRTMDKPSVFVASLIKQIIHIGTDLYTPCGIQIPGANLLLSNKNVEKLTKYVSTGDLVKISSSAGVAEFINLIVSTVHMLTYDGTISRDLFSVKTRKIILYSNLIATASNVIWVGANMYFGNAEAVKQLDIGGLIVIIKRLLTDAEYIRQIKKEFVFGSFNKMIQGDELKLEEITW